MSKRYQRYTALDAAALAAVAVVSGAIFLLASDYLYVPLQGASSVYPIMSIAWPVIYGFWFLGGTAAGYIIRKPGAAFAGEFLGSVVEMVMGSYFGLDAFIWGVLQAASSELGFAIWGYKRWDYVSMSVAGFLPGLPIQITGWYLYPSLYIAVLNYAGYAGLAAFILLHCISGLIIAGILTKIFIDLIARSGALDIFEIGREVKRK
ncbi:MAG TPA: ECF transporter S component [Geobacterales bacterium]|nr:ECF transporter S component [Geobacterales bacterium]